MSVVQRPVSFNMVKLLLQTSPKATLHGNKEGNIALHLAFDQPDVVAAILDVCPEAAKERDLPLHIALKKGTRFEVVRSVLQAYPEAAQGKS